MTLIALRHNNYWRGLDIHEPRKEALSLFADLMKYNRHLTRVRLAVGGEEKSTIELAHVLKSIPTQSLQMLQLHGNHIGDKGMIALGGIFQLPSIEIIASRSFANMATLVESH